MRLNVIFRYIGLVMLINAGFMLAAVVVSCVSGFDGSLYALLLSALLTAVIGAMPVMFVPSEKQMSNKEIYCVGVGSWLMSCVVGMVPFLLWGGEFDLLGAWFESVSGYTSTGATVLADVEALPNGLLFWRSCTSWIGGAGVVMFALLIMPMLNRSKMMAANVDISTVAKDNYKYRSATILKILLTVYLGLTAACLLLLKTAGMGWFDSLNHAMSTVATGGFSTRNESVAFWNSPWIEAVIMVFMAVSGLHFGVIFATITGKRNNIFRSEVARYYLIFMAAASIAIAAGITLNGTYESFWTALRFSSFQTVSASSSAAFMAADTGAWGSLAVVLLIFAGIQCACGGSTSGGIKADRVYIAIKMIRAQIRQQQHPNAVIRVKLDNVTQAPAILGFVMLFIVFYLLTIAAATVVMAACGHDLLTSFSLAAANLSNVGSGFGQIGGFSTYAQLPAFTKFFCTLLMLLGRLELFGFLQLLMIRAWK